MHCRTVWYWRKKSAAKATPFREKNSTRSTLLWEVGTTWATIIICKSKMYRCLFASIQLTGGILNTDLPISSELIRISVLKSHRFLDTRLPASAEWEQLRRHINTAAVCKKEVAFRFRADITIASLMKMNPLLLLPMLFLPYLLKITLCGFMIKNL